MGVVAMPYVITTTPGDVREAEERNGARLTGIMDGSQPATPDSEAATRDALAKLDRMKSRRAVATLDEARQWTHDECALRCADDSAADALTIPESGGTIGPLPDGTVIEVAPHNIVWFEAELEARGIRTAGMSDAEVIDAYNAAQS